MRHFVIILMLVIAGYSIWQVLNKEDRASVKNFVKRHGVNLGIVVAVLFMLFLYAAQQGSFFQLF